MDLAAILPSGETVYLGHDVSPEAMEDPSECAIVTLPPNNDIVEQLSSSEDESDLLQTFVVMNDRACGWGTHTLVDTIRHLQRENSGLRAENYWLRTEGAEKYKWGYDSMHWGFSES